MTVIERLLDSQGICKALAYTEPNFLDQPDIIDPSDLIMDKIFPYYRIPDSEKEVESYVLMQFRNYRLVNRSYKCGFLNIFAITHKSLVPTDYGFLRYDFILSEIDELINDVRGIGVGKPSFHQMDEVFINNDYLGNFVSYKLWEFN